MNKFYTRIKKMFGKLFKVLLRVKIENPEKETQGRPFIVCCNHTSLLDVIVISLALKNQIRYLAKKEVFKVPIVRWIVKGMGAVAVDRKSGDVGAIKKAVEILKGGECVGIFPQGTRCPYVNPRETEIKDGIGMIANRAEVGILPIYIKTKKNRVKFFRKTKLIIGDFIPPETFSEDVHGREKYKLISDYAFDKVCSLGEGVTKI